MDSSLTIGTRGSQLAIWQANWVKSAIETRHPAVSVCLLTIKTKGDRIQDVPLARVGGKGLFVKEIEDAILEGRVDLAVHSMKDMPAELPAGLAVGAVPRRENPADVLISRNGRFLEDQKTGARVGTSSLRRGAQLRYLRPDLEVVPLRGNLDTRLRKLDTEGLDAVVLAAAGVLRLDLADRITQYLDPTDMLPAVGQGALCIEVRQDDPRVTRLLTFLDDPATRTAVRAERAFLRRLEGGCQVPIAAHATLQADRLVIDGMVAELDGSRLLRRRIDGPASQADSLGRTLAESLLADGADDILEKLKADFYAS